MAELDTATSYERAVLVGIDRPDAEMSLQASLDELARLTETAGAIVVGTTSQRLDHPNPKTFVGSGKVDEIKMLALSLAADMVIFDDELTPSQQSNLERSLPKNVKVFDRTALILDIFALHAQTKEGRLQVRLAQNQYLLPRLRGMWAHLASNRMGGGVGSRFGEGESQLEVDRRMVRKRISSIKRQLEQLDRTRMTQRSNRMKTRITNVSLAGYTNVGKSQLLNLLADETIESADKLFATLDSTTRRLRLPQGREITLTDTVGFIRKLPTTLVEAFKSTLREIVDADLILHVIDASSDDFIEQRQAVNDILQQIGAEENPRIEVFNKCDLLDDEVLAGYRRRFPDGVFISAKTGMGISDLQARIADALDAAGRETTLLIPYDKGSIVSYAHTVCTVVSEEHSAEGTIMNVRVPTDAMSRLKPYVI